MTLSLFEGYGIEIESMVVDADTLDVRPVVDELLRRAAGGEDWVEDVDDGAIAWSNELVTHVVELKTNGPVPTLDGLAEAFRKSAGRLNALLADGWSARLLPSAMHPWMDPARETRLWPHDTGPVYRAYDRLFDCRRHGWANLQSVHLNLPFADERELGQLLAAARLVLPLIPALAASSPVLEGRVTGLLDNRLDAYRTNSSRLPAMTGDVIPEPVYGIEAYRTEVLGAVDRALAEIDAPEVLRGQEWTNARGAIVRFDRMAVEIRLIDAQECAAADLALCAAVTGVVRGLVEERWSSWKAQSTWPTADLSRLLDRAAREGPATELADAGYAALFGLEAAQAPTLGGLWEELVEETFAAPPELGAALEVVLRRGPLARRILDAVGPEPRREDLRAVYGRLGDCLGEGRSFLP